MQNNVILDASFILVECYVQTLWTDKSFQIIPPSHLGFSFYSPLYVQHDETVSKRIKLPNEEEKDVPVTRSRRRVQDYHGDIIGEQFWEEHPDILEDDS